MYFKVGDYKNNDQDYYVSLDMFKTPFVVHTHPQKFALGILSYVRDNACKRPFRQFIFDNSMVVVDTTGTCGNNGGMSLFMPPFAALTLSSMVGLGRTEHPSCGLNPTPAPIE
jgi:hypothetical protein